jgi:DNA-binding NarL/FixJ family response regulator
MLARLTKSGDTALTSRQAQVLQLIADGMTNPAIADSLGLSERTVDRHVSNILTRLNVPTRAAATAYALSHGLIDTGRAG